MNPIRLLTVVFLACALPLPAHAAPGDLDPLYVNVAGSNVYSTAVQPDGKIIIGGTFTSVLGVPRNNIARLNADGTLDTGFDPKANNVVYSVAVQADGKVLLGGGFTTLQPNGAGAAIPRQYIARLHADGTLDTGFNPKANSYVICFAVQADDKVLFGGGFTSLQPNGAASATTRNRIARVHADGTLDTGFNPNPNSYVYSVAVQADGKVLLGGIFYTLQPNGSGVATSRQYIARVHADGTLDTGFDPKPNLSVYSVAVQADGKVLLGGQFFSLQPNGAFTSTPRIKIARVHADGTLDTGFNPKANEIVFSVAVQADGKVLLGGQFNTLQPNGAGAATTRQYIARVNADGTLDAGFNPNANNLVYGVTVQADGKVLLGGQFTALQPNGAGAATARNFFARLENDAATQTLTVPNTTQALWSRSGAGPELSRVTFELSTNGGASWGTPIAGTRIGTTANWQAVGLSLPVSGQLRARGMTTGGIYNGSSGLIEQVVSFGTGQSAYEAWATANGISTDPAALGGDNLLAFASGYTPGGSRGALEYAGTLAGSGTITATGQPITRMEGADVRAVFVRRKDYLAAGLTYTAQFSATLGVWEDSVAVPTVLADDGTNQIVSVPYPALVAGLPPQFFRLRVTITP